MYKHITQIWQSLFKTDPISDPKDTPKAKAETPDAQIKPAQTMLAANFKAAPEQQDNAPLPDNLPDSLPDSLPEGQLTITSDVMGTLNIKDARYNLELFTFLMDAAEKGHRIIITSTIDLEWETALFLASRLLNRDVPDNFEFIEKADLPFKVDTVHIAFDDKHFIYLPKNSQAVKVSMDDLGKPSVPYETLRKLARLDEDSSDMDMGKTGDMGPSGTRPSPDKNGPAI